MLKLPVLTESPRLRYFTFFYLYAMQGLPAGFALTAIANYLIGSGVSARAVGNFDALIGIPWILQFIVGALIDRYQFSGMGHRKHWIVFSQIAAFFVTLSLLFIKQPATQFQLIGWIFFTHSIFASIQDASVDATAIAITPVHQQGRVNAWMRAGWLLGIAIGAAGLSTVVHLYGFYWAAACQSGLLLVLTIATFITKIERDDSYKPSFNIKTADRPSQHPDDNPNLKWLFSQLYRGIMQKKSLRQFGLIAVVYLCLNTFLRSLNFHLIHNLHWNDNDLSVLQGTWASVVTIIVTLGGGIIADKMGAPKLLRIVIICICAFFLIFCGLGALWVHRTVSTLGVLLYSVADPTFSVAAMPVLMALCLLKVEGSQFTAYMAIVNLSDVTGSYLSGWGMSITTGPVVGFCCGLLILIALIAYYLWRPASKMAVSTI